MRDPLEGVSPDGTITTGADRGRVPADFEPVLRSLLELLERPASSDRVSLYLYGSVATGQAVPGRSDVDVFTVGLPPARRRQVSGLLTARYADRCRGVEVGGGEPQDWAGDSDQAYGNRVFLRHYCVHLSGPDLRAGLPRYPADARAARGFNGDLARHAERWRAALRSGGEASGLGRRMARKTLLALAGVVSVHDRTWTTDRGWAAQRWGEVVPAMAADLAELLTGAEAELVPTTEQVDRWLVTVVPAVLDHLRAEVGLWSADGHSGD